MTTPGIQEKVIEILVTMNTAAINLRLYPPTNPMIKKTIDELYETFLIIFGEVDSVIFSEAERNLLISGEPLSQKYLGRPQVAIFLTLMINWGIKSLTFLKGLGKNELVSFLETMSKKPDEVKSKRGLEQIISEGGMSHILFNQKVYIKGADDQGIAYIQQAYRHVMSACKGINQEKNVLHKNVSETSSGIVQDLFSEDENETAETIIDRLSNKLISDNTDIRDKVSEALAKILENLSPEKRTDILTRLSAKLIEWIKFETKLTMAYGSICKHLEDLAQGRIRDQRFVDAYHIIETFRLIISNQIQKSDDIRSTASDTLREITSDDILDILTEEFRTNKGNMRNEAGRILVMLAEFSINRLLYLLKESNDSFERVLILNLIPEIGPAAVPAVIGMIKQDTPWYYLRNLVRLLGRIGSEEHAIFLAQLLAYDNYRVQREALKSIGNIGGSQRGEILLDALTKCDDRIKANIVTTLGSLKYRDAVKPLIVLFKSKFMVSEEVKVDLQEKICLALGHIGDREALPFLMDISKQSGFFSLKTFHPTVKAAAEKAVGWIMSKS